MIFASVCDYEKKAAELLPKKAWDYYRSGAGDEFSLHLNKSAYER